MNKYRRKIVIWSIFFGLTFILCEYLMARAGGGGGFRSSGGGGFGSSGGSNGDGGGLGVIIYLLIRLIIQYPVVGVPAAIIVVALFIYGGSKGHSAHVSRSIRRTYNRFDARKVELAESKLKSRDPNYDREALFERIKKGFLMIQDAWAKQDMKPVRHLISDGIFERFSIQFDIQKGSLIRNDMSNVQIQSIMLADVESDQFFDTIHLQISASAVDIYKRLDNDKHVAGSSVPETFVEYWSFLRRPGAQTLAKPGLIEGYCPNCGDLLEMADCTVCPSCQALINSGEYDWVLAEITQETEWSQRNRREIPGLEDMIQKDPAFNIQHIEDKVSVMFCRYVAARFFANTDYLVKMASPQFINDKKEQFTAKEDGSHEYYADAAVGSVDVVEIIPNQADDKDQVRLKVKFAAHQECTKVPAFLPPRYDRNHIFVTDFIVERNGDVKSSDKNVLTSAHCPGCGAPETRSTNGYCEYCRTPLNDGSSGWVLCDIRRFSGYPEADSGYQTLETKPVDMSSQGFQSLSVFDRESIICCAIAVMMADGEISDSEKQVLLKMVRENGIDEQRLDILINTVNSGNYHLPVPQNVTQANDFLRALVAMCVADGHVSSQEKQLIKQLVAKMNFTDFDINQIIKQEMRRLHQQVKAVRRGND